MMKPVTRYECSYCKNLFKTPDKHHCKMDPVYGNCYACALAGDDCQMYRKCKDLHDPEDRDFNGFRMERILIQDVL